VAGGLVEEDSFVTGGIVFTHTDISVVLLSCTDAKIASCIVQSVTVSMVGLSFREVHY
jgi:hypothetical protein